jgi:hypothetical protein
MPDNPRGDELPDRYGPSEYIPYWNNPAPPGVPPYQGQGNVPPYAPTPQYPAVPPYRRDPFMPPTQPQQGSIPFIPTAPLGQKKRKRGRWLIAGILICLLVVSIPAFFVIRYINRSTPDKTLDAFCSAVQQEDYQSAYDLFTPNLQRTMSETVFAAALSQDKVTACSHAAAPEAGTSVTSNLQLVHASKGVNRDIVTLTKDSNDNWQINDVYKQT